jgi:YgiT-type zinc finger domain-containing protein
MPYLQTRRHTRGHCQHKISKKRRNISIQNVPAQICNNCGEKYFTDNITQSIMKQAESAIDQGVQINVRQYKVA